MRLLPCHSRAAPMPLLYHVCHFPVKLPCHSSAVPPLSLLYHSVPYRHIIVICFDGSIPLISFAFKVFFSQLKSFFRN